VFLGPLNTLAVVKQATTNEPQVAVGMREFMLDAYDAAHNVWDSSVANIRHSIYSRTDGVNRLVEEVSCDDEFDTVRRRGQKPNLRMSRPITPALAQTGRAGTDVALAT
jgi:hypothetical protein